MAVSKTKEYPKTHPIYDRKMENKAGRDLRQHFKRKQN
jgi:hypothetical protein